MVIDRRTDLMVMLYCDVSAQALVREVDQRAPDYFPWCHTARAMSGTNENEGSMWELS